MGRMGWAGTQAVPKSHIATIEVMESGRKEREGEDFVDVSVAAPCTQKKVRGSSVRAGA